jgi:hypothetical protein
MRLGALEEAAAAIWSSMLGITYMHSLQLGIFITLRLCGTVPENYMS